MKIGEPYHLSMFTGAKRRLIMTQDTYQYVPLLSSLHSLLRDPSVIDQIDQCPSRIHTDGIIEDICDGNIFKSHPIFSVDPYALQIIIFFDELELCNPLGTHIKKAQTGNIFIHFGEHTSEIPFIT